MFNPEELKELLAKIKEKKEKEKKIAWSILESEIQSKIIAEEVKKEVENMFRDIQRPEIIPEFHYQKPFAKTLSSTYDFIREEKAGQLLEFSLTTTNKNFALYLDIDGNLLISGLSMDELLLLSPDLAWLTAVQKTTGEYLLQISGLEFKNKLVIAIEPNETIEFYNIAWSYITYKRQ